MENEFERELRRKKVDLNDYVICFEYSISHINLFKEIEPIQNVKKSIPTFLGTSRPIHFIYLDKKENARKKETISYPFEGFPLETLFDKSEKSYLHNSLEIDSLKMECFLNKTIQSLSPDFLAKMFSRYYIDGFCKFCVYISPENYENLLLYKFFFPPILYKNFKFFLLTEQNAKDVVMSYYLDMIEFINNSYHNKCLDKIIFLKFISSLYEIISQYEFKNDLTHEDCNLLDEMLKYLAVKADIVSDYLTKTITSLTDELIKKKILSRCQYCNSILKYRLNKKYCSTVHENRDCGKKARAKKYYLKNKDKIKIKAKKDAKERRELYKQLGVKIH